MNFALNKVFVFSKQNHLLMKREKIDKKFERKKEKKEKEKLTLIG